MLFFDFETRSRLDLKEVGAYKYACHPSTEILVLSWCGLDGFAKVWSNPKYDPDGARDDPDELFAHVEAGGLVVAHNATFDRLIWQFVAENDFGWPALESRHVLCSQAQAEASCIPGGLADAAKTLRLRMKKDTKGKSLIRLMSDANKPWEDRFHGPELMGHFKVYAAKDTVVARDVFKATRPLSREEWEVYWASEEVNDRGMGVDVGFAKAATRLADLEAASYEAEIRRVTGDDKMTVANSVRKAKWLEEQLRQNDELVAILKSEAKRKDGTKYIKTSTDKPTREALEEALDDADTRATLSADRLERIEEFLEILEAAAGVATKKFRAVSRMAVGGRVYGQYRFSGAGQTGRWSSRGIQIHNLIRLPLEPNWGGWALFAPGEFSVECIDAISRVGSYRGATDRDVVGVLEESTGLPLQRVLSRLLRSTLVAADGHDFVWADWSAIEARVLPWLAGSRGGERVLDVFRAFDAKQGPDIYKTAASQIFKKPVTAISKDERQVGKVATLALGFGGSVGALKKMAKAYGMKLDETFAKEIVDGWRAANPWAKAFWYRCNDAMLDAMHSPGAWQKAGRLRYLYTPSLMRGTLCCQLPSGRLLVYPRARVKEMPNKWTGEMQERIVYEKVFGSTTVPQAMWHGIAVENATQACANDVLRAAVVRFRRDCVGHTHDEIIREVPIDQVASVLTETHDAMTTPPGWATGLPLAVEVEHGPYYTKEEM